MVMNKSAKDYDKKWKKVSMVLVVMGIVVQVHSAKVKVAVTFLRCLQLPLVQPTLQQVAKVKMQKLSCLDWLHVFQIADIGAHQRRKIYAINVIKIWLLKMLNT
jgi:hypothetical protein